MHDFPGNSQKAKNRPEVPQPEERPRIEQVTSVPADQRKRGLGRKFKETFILGSTRDAADHMITDIIVPEIKSTIVEALQGGIERLFNGEGNRPRRYTPPTAYPSGPRIDYNGMNRPPASQTVAQRSLSRRSQTLHNFGEIIIEDRRDAQEVLDQLYEFLSRFGEVKVSDLYALTGIQTSHVDHKWGWVSLKGARLKRLSDGRFLLDLPEPDALN